MLLLEIKEPSTDTDILDNTNSVESSGCQPSNSSLSSAPSTSSGSDNSALVPQSNLVDKSGLSTVPGTALW